MTFGKQADPDLTKLLDKKLAIKLNGNRTVHGILRGFDTFMNIALKDTVEVVSPTEKYEIGMVIIRGNSILLMEPLESMAYVPKTE
ncbi:LSM domain-containing protein [Dictyostelium discoideum AX4]|uniref:Probable small nuclear ribonucleoprotein G n=1 Tax=Dictyostelium discoideum TaxID=44689 RepID=RUXG_DICDI|nr:LSM domain-containing protein [Dictyostelium discoideum AX4]Q54RX0.1 RecName: Full=Probable small nuclear ribonucleoprotein G; Short=snRNP-G; AltName: Full=Sm protein G; Short=Sm-G; Short=SmG [Dictyostelium discoideum]EAL66011.1 LSM domain-containing protein [Dictyostelium discoideum AX4]|eukprot:XP_639367.1 LSM domain-containing protein [Dictyostelium discoideum AX4]